MTLEQFEAIEKYFMALIDEDNSIENAVLLINLREQVVNLLDKAQEK